MINNTFLLDTADFIGIVSFALSGFYVATRDRLDLLGIFIASFLTALGGGIIRDVIATREPFAFISFYPATIVLVVLFVSITFKFHKRDKIENSKYLVLSDSIGLISFSISGSLVGIHSDFNFFGVAILSVITATGGGVMRDMLLNKIPFLLVSELYGTVALLISLAIYTLNIFNCINIFSLTIVFILGLLLRLIAYNKKWHLPHLE
ncbi:MAG: trimeric intracellular cation channel family protein [Sulfurospirillaceae bacterium]|nr:trimeric intracellular cation channel family protein [Sulfurospirillaceae bacterium]